ncbi:broad specificity phosphatase PhoE [Bacillus sp. V2I10]|nr:broad specificity phosphatase PhoE [Bacillus sp. V2I10]
MQRLLGRFDSPLNGLGKKQALLLAICLIAVKVAAVYMSPLKRARKTTYIFGQQLSVNMKRESDLSERSFGYLDGLLRNKTHTCQYHEAGFFW